MKTTIRLSSVSFTPSELASAINSADADASAKVAMLRDLRDLLDKPSSSVADVVSAFYQDYSEDYGEPIPTALVYALCSKVAESVAESVAERVEGLRESDRFEGDDTPINAIVSSVCVNRAEDGHAQVADPSELAEGLSVAIADIAIDKLCAGDETAVFVSLFGLPNGEAYSETIAEIVF